MGGLLRMGGRGILMRPSDDGGRAKVAGRRAKKQERSGRGEATMRAASRLSPQRCGADRGGNNAGRSRAERLGGFEHGGDLRMGRERARWRERAWGGSEDDGGRRGGEDDGERWEARTME